LRVASRIADFNYKVALASGLKSLQGGRLRQAEEQFRYLVQKFPQAEGGHRGLAKVLIEQEDRTAALRVLLDGGAALAKADQRTKAITLYREAVTLFPRDHGAHRRLAAALLNSGETDEAANEFVRFIANTRVNEPERATSEAAYALERLPGNAEVARAAREVGALGPPLSAQPETPAPAFEPTTPDDRAALLRAAFGKPDESTTSMESAEPAATTSWSAPPAMPAESGPSAEQSWNTPSMPADPWAATPSETPASPWRSDAAAASQSETAPAAPSVQSAQSAEAAAARYIADGDPRAGQQAIEAARRYIADGRMDAASDLLLQLIASGIDTHDAQRLLVEVAKSLGKKDVAKAKVQLLIEALKLDGRADLAAEVEQEAQAP
jgi:thioredoxin-like negative regulator of GroEL